MKKPPANVDCAAVGIDPDSIKEETVLYDGPTRGICPKARPHPQGRYAPPSPLTAARSARSSRATSTPTPRSPTPASASTAHNPSSSSTRSGKRPSSRSTPRVPYAALPAQPPTPARALGARASCTFKTCTRKLVDRVLALHERVLCNIVAGCGASCLEERGDQRRDRRLHPRLHLQHRPGSPQPHKSRQKASVRLDVSSPLFTVRNCPAQMIGSTGPGIHLR